MNKNLLLLPLFSLSVFGCNKNSSDLWNKTFKSTGRIVVNYDAKVNDKSNINKLTFLKNNFNNIKWDQSGVEEDYPFLQIIPFDSSECTDFNTLKNHLDYWWVEDVSHRNIKNTIDHTTTIIKKESDLTGSVTFSSDINPRKPAEITFNATDKSDKQNGSYLEINLPDKPATGYVYYSNYRDVVVIRNGPNDNSEIKFTFKLITPVDGIESFNINSYIEITQPKFKMPWWGIFLIVLGSVIFISAIYLIIKQYRRNHHQY